jgi:hypothetical protein
VLLLRTKTGELFWKHRPLKHFSSSSMQKQLNTRFAGKPAGALLKPKQELIVSCG